MSCGCLLEKCVHIYSELLDIYFFARKKLYFLPEKTFHQMTVSVYLQKIESYVRLQATHS